MLDGNKEYRHNENEQYNEQVQKACPVTEQ